jgi:hypothetical protein
VIRDRGSIKWTAMMLPEHVKLLREYEDIQDRVEKPHLDEQKYEEFNEVICMAMEENRALRFTCYKRGLVNQVTGHVHYVDELRQQLRVMDETEKTAVLNVMDIIEINVSE